MSKNMDGLIIEVSERLALLEDCLPRAADGYALSPDSKLPFIALNYRESLIWRMAELSRCAFDELKAERLAAAILLTRGAVETCAALWYLNRKISAAIDAQALGETADFLRRLSVGSLTEEDGLKAIRVGKFVDIVDKEIEGFKQQYAILSETAHPNWAGTTGLYSKIDYGRGTAVYGSNVRLQTGTMAIGVANLSAALLLFEHTYNDLSAKMPAFISLCAAEATKQPETPQNS